MMNAARVMRTTILAGPSHYGSIAKYDLEKKQSYKEYCRPLDRLAGTGLRLKVSGASSPAIRLSSSRGSIASVATFERASTGPTMGAKALPQPSSLRIHKSSLEAGVLVAQRCTLLVHPRLCTLTGMDFAAGTLLPSAWCHSGSNGLHSG